MILNSENLQAIFQNLKLIYNDALSTAPSVYSEIATLSPSNSGQEIYPWLGSFPKMREWVDEKQIKNLKAHSYTLVNKPFEATIELRRENIEDDSVGILSPQVKAMAWAAKAFPDDMVFDLLNNGFTNKCYDGAAFFSASHKVGSGTVSNTSADNLACDTQANALGSLGKAFTALKKMKDSNGYSLGIVPSLLVVPPALSFVANTLLVSDKLDDGKANPFKGAFKILEDNRITNDKYWFVLDTTKVLKPLIYQERKAPEFVPQVSVESDTVFNRGVYRYSVEARGNAGYGFWQMAFGSTGT